MSHCIDICQIPAPCKDCKRRHYKCWGECEDYKKYKAEVEKVNAARRDYLMKSNLGTYKKKWRKKYD